MQQVIRLRRKLRFVGVLVAVALLAAFYRTYFSARQAQEMNAWVAHTQAVLRIMATVRLERSQLVNTLWAYRSTRDPEFAFLFASKVQRLAEDVRRLEALTQDNPAQQQILRQIAAEVTEQTAKMETALDLADAPRLTYEILAISGTQMSWLLDRLETNERQLLSARSDRLRQSARATTIEVLLAALMTQLVLGFAAHLVQKHLLMRVELEDGMRRARELLGLKYQEQGMELHKAIESLQAENSARREAESEARKLNEELEQRVEQRTRELEDLNRELESFSYSVSHDLRAPLRHMNGFATILEEEHGPSLPKDAHHYLRRIRNASEHMSELVEGLLQLARIGRHSAELRRCPVRSIVEEARAELDTGQREVEWVVGALPEVEADPTLLRQVFANLLSNAVKFTRGRSPAVIEIGARESQGVAMIYVRDNGAGFDGRYAAKLFGVFQRLHRADEFEGTGIGLATVQRIVQKHGGRIWAEGEPGRGASFYFTLPLARQAASESRRATGALA